MSVLKKIIIFMLTVVAASCQDWLDVNEDPDNPAEMDFMEVLPSGISSVAYVVGGRYQVLGALWSQHWTQSLGASQYAGIDSYDINSSSFDDRQFGELYSGALKALEYVKTESESVEEWKFYLVATVVQAYTFQILADLYDEIPFSDALKGESGLLTPRYERGMDVYDSLIVRIDKALSKDFDDDDLLDPGIRDILFQGNMSLWEEFANTLKLKIYLRQSEARPEVAREGIEGLFNDEADFLETDVFMTQFMNRTGNRNPLYETDEIFFGGNPNLVLSRTLHSFLQENNDLERLEYMFYNPASGGAPKSLVQGNYNDPDEPAGTNSSIYSKPIINADDPVYLLSASESHFLQAEAIIRYNVATYTEAREQYEEGITRAYERVLIPFIGRVERINTDFIEELAKSFREGTYRFPSEGSPEEVFIEKIIIQKWVSLAGIQSLETFFEHNRTHYPEISDILPDDENYIPGQFTVSVNNVTSGRFPKRLVFPESEVSGNPNVPDFKPVWEKLWWDTKL